MKALHNGEACPLSDIPLQSFEEFRSALLRLVGSGGHVAAFFGVPATALCVPPTAQGGESEGSVRVFAVLADSGKGELYPVSTEVRGRYPSLTPDCPHVHLFERELYEQTGVMPEGHPWLKPVRNPFTTSFYRLSGGEAHEVAVGPVHAGVIEPGHFRFQCNGETVMHLEIVLGYQHRGLEKALRGGPDRRTAAFVETAAGDTTIGHSYAHSLLCEALAATKAPARAEAIRAIALEFERMANHVGDLGALSGDVGYLPTKSFCGRLRGDFLNLTAELCGNRFGRNLLRPGGTLFDVEADLAAGLSGKTRALLDQTDEAVNLLWDNSSVLARFEDTGRLTKENVFGLGLVGPAARACGLSADVRSDFPTGIFQYSHVPISTYPTGDVMARAMVRQLEYQRSARFVIDTLGSLPEGPVMKAAAPGQSGARSDMRPGAPTDYMPESFAVALTEGWRGEICHCALTGSEGRFSAYKITDPSFHNWSGLAYALRGQQISDFPLCNKSFNLSYCGHDL